MKQVIRSIGTVGFLVGALGIGGSIELDNSPTTSIIIALAGLALMWISTYDKKDIRSTSDKSSRPYFLH